MPSSKKICENCRVNIGTKNRIHSLILCEQCSHSPDYEMICKSIAKNKYKLNDKDLINIEYIEVDNPHFKCAAKMKLFLEKDIKKYADEKHKNDHEQKLTDYTKNILKQKSVRTNTKKIQHNIEISIAKVL